VLGVVWIDTNRNGRQEANEPGMPKTLVKLERTSSPAVQSLSVVKQSAALPETYTDSSGAYSFENVEPGQWSVKAILNSQALSTVYDSSGNTDWIVPVSVPVNGEARGDFAAAGSSSISGDLKNQNGVTVPDGTAEVVWAGPDGILGTDDDVVFPVVIKNGSFSMSGVPEGRYVVKGRASDGREAQDTSINVKQGLNKTEMRVIDTLPETGYDLISRMMLPLLMSLIGFALLIRRRQSENS
jgi:hypothetical protein